MGPSVILCLLLVSALPVPARMDGPKEEDLDIYSYHIKSEVTSRYAITVITSRVANRANTSREVNFHVEIPKNAFITNFSMTIDGHTYDGVVKKKGEAQRQYSQAVSRGQSAGLVSAVGRSLEEFKTSVTVAALSKVTFELTYEELLKRRLGKYELLIKTKPSQVVKDFKIDVHIYEQPGISFLHTQGSLLSTGLARLVNTTLSDKEARVQFRPTRLQQQQCSGCVPTGLNGDLLVVYDVKRLTSLGDIQVSQGYFVHYFAPRDLQRIPKNVVFIIDQSGSMHGRKMEQTRQAMLKILVDIEEEDHFGLITFDDRLFSWKSDLVPATSDYLAAARLFVSNIEDNGATDINAALLEGVKMLDRFNKTQPHKGSTSILILLTDGDPTSGVIHLETIQTNVRKAIGGRHTLFCLGFGFDVNYQFLEKMSLENGGVARRIYPDSDADLQLQGFYKEVATPLLLDLRVNYSGASNITKTRFGQYYNGSEIVIAGRVARDLETLEVEVKAQAKSDEVVYRSERMGTYIFQTYIQRLWAYLTVQQLLEQEILLTGEKQKAVREEALGISLRYHFVTPLTSMVVTKPEGEDTQVLHKPKEGKQSASQRVDLSAQNFYLLGQVALYSDSVALIEPDIFQDHPLIEPDIFHDHPLIEADMFYDHPLNILPTIVNFVDPTESTQYPHTTGTRSLRFLLPATGGNTPLCFDVSASGERLFKLLEDPSTGVSLTGQVGMVSRKDFSEISIRYRDDLHISVDTRWVNVSHGPRKEDLSWAQTPSHYQSPGVSVVLQDRRVEVTMGETEIGILLHGEDEERFLWPVIRKTASGSSSVGLMGQPLVSYEQKQIRPTAILEVLGKQVEASRDSAVDFSNASQPVIDCWLLSYQSALQAELSDITVF